MLVSGVLPEHGAAGGWDVDFVWPVGVFLSRARRQHNAAEHWEHWLSLPRACDPNAARQGIGKYVWRLGIFFFAGSHWVCSFQGCSPIMARIGGWDAVLIWLLGGLASAPPTQRGWEREPALGAAPARCAWFVFVSHWACSRVLLQHGAVGGYETVVFSNAACSS